jgi:hypothetical protein
MQTTSFRTLILVWMVLHVWWFSLPLSAYKQPAYVLEAIEHSGRGSAIPASDALAYGILATIVTAAAGMLVWQRWARRLFLGTIVVTVALQPFQGVAVLGPFDGFLGSVVTLLEGAIIAAAFWSPLASRFSAERSPSEVGADGEESEIATPLKNEELLEVFEANDPGQVAVVSSVLRGAGIEFMTVNEGVENLLVAGQLGGGNVAIGPVQFLVRERDFETARRALSPEDR